MKSFSALCLLAFIAIVGLTLVAAGYDPTNDPVPGPIKSSLPGQPLSPFDEPIETVGPEALTTFVKPEGVEFTKAVLMVENNCKLRNQFRGARAFLHLEAGYYPELYTKLVSGLPRIKFFELESDFQNAAVDPSVMSQEEILQMIKNVSANPNYYDPKGKVATVMISRDTTQEELVELMSKFNIGRTMDFDLAKRPDLHETSEDRSDGRKFEHDEILRELDPSHSEALPHADYDYDKELAKREESLNEKNEQLATEEVIAQQKLAEKTAAAAAEASKKHDEL